MRTVSIHILLSLLTLTLISCEKENGEEQNTRNLEFNDLKIGDVMLYSYMTGNEIGDNQNGEVIYTGDTLELNVIDIIDGKFLIQEEITAGSAIHDSDDIYIWGTIDEATTLLWDISEDSIIITSPDPEVLRKSQLLFHNYTFSLKEITENEIEFDEWKTTNSNIGGFDFYINNGELHGISYPHLNAIIFSMSPVDADGTTHIFNKESGFVRTSSISPWTSLVRGWDRIN